MIARLLVTVLLALAPAVAAAHGEHGDAKALGTTSTVTVDGYQVELLSVPGPLTAGRSGQVIAKVMAGPALRPVGGGRVRIGLGRADGVLDPRPAAEATWAGNYAVAVTPARAGDYRVRIVLESLEGRVFASPLVLDFPVTVGATPGLGVAVWALLAFVGGVAALGVYRAGLRARLGEGRDGALNLLDIPWVRGLVTSRMLQPTLQLALLAVTGLVMFLGFHDVQDGGMNLATKLTWTVWWAGIIFTFVLAGRVWCAACPFGALNEWTARLAGAWRRLPRPFRNIWWATGAFVLLTWADEYLGVVRSPRVTAWIVVFFLALAVATGLVYERRSFCRFLCPIGGLIGIYSMAAPLELRAKDVATCRGHADKECYRGRATSPGCPMFEFPQAMDRNNYCTFCAACVTSCSQDNLVLRVRSFGKDLWATSRRALDEAYLAVALVGLTLLVTAQMLSGWSAWISALAGWLPALVRTNLKPVTYLSLVESGIFLGGTLVVAPLLVLAAAAVADRCAGEHALGVRRTFVTFGYMFIPIGLAMHLAHNLSHLLLEGGGIVPVVQRAVATYSWISLGEPDWHVAPLAPEPVVGLLQAVAVVGFFALTLTTGHRLAARVYADRRAASRAVVPFVILAVVFTVVGIALLQQPMGMRHGM